MSDDSVYQSMVHGLRMRGWSRQEAEAEALDRLEQRRQRQRLPELTCGGVGVNYTVGRDGRIVFQ